MAGPQRKPVNKKKIMPVKTTRVANIDYKDTNLLKKFIRSVPVALLDFRSRISARSQLPSRTRVRLLCCPTPQPLADWGVHHEAHSHQHR